MQTILVAIIVAAAVSVAFRHLWRLFSGKSKGCDCCNNCDCCKDRDGCDCGCGKKDTKTRQ